MAVLYRVALYWAPEPSDALHALGACWLGRDPETAATLPQPVVEGLDLRSATLDPRRYGLHATLRAPFRPAVPYAALREVAAALAARTAGFDLPALRFGEEGDFLALREAGPSNDMAALADAAVRALDPCRAPLSEAEIARRRPERLSARQRTQLDRWGYPYVFEDFHFHVSLTGRLEAAAMHLARAAAEKHFPPASLAPRPVRELCLFTQAAPDAPFLIAERLPLGGGMLTDGAVSGA